MPLPSAVLALTVSLLASACARTTLEEVEDEGGVVERDAAALDASAEDARQQLDASDCSDRDDDGVCDDGDNCPDDSNADQRDDDDDGTGDACEAATDCDADQIPASVKAGTATVLNVKINGSAGPAVVSKGQSLTLSFNYSFPVCLPSTESLLREVAAGLEGEATGTCRVLTEFPCPFPVLNTANTTLMLNAPNEPGTYYIVGGGREGLSAECSNNLRDAARIAAICVR